MLVPKILIGIAAASVTGIAGTYAVRKFVLKDDEEKNNTGKSSEEEARQGTTTDQESTESLPAATRDKVNNQP